MSSPIQRQLEIFSAALEHPAGPERDAFLAQACAGDETLRRHVDALLAGNDQAGTFLAKPAGMLCPGETDLEPVIEKPGDKIGRYKLLQQIGEGGCGVVYMAEQEEPVRRRVALKVIRVGMDTKQVVARFEAERQALALMDHPNIAKVLDGGATGAAGEADAAGSQISDLRSQISNLKSQIPQGRPYFVMELVRGVKITEYCDQTHLSTEERLKLFIQVCQAVQHAHQKGIIHRDIKPSNILVTVNDGVAVPKVIDFGIAKATDQRLTDKTYFTQFQAFIGTPAYTSPEQAEMSSLDIDTRSDIYSLGVLLYELLTGQTPFPAERLLQSGLDEMRRIIREEEPLRPSTRLTTLPLSDAAELSRKRQLKVPTLASAVRGDLDWIVMKALEKDRTRRYANSLDFAADIQRHLDNEPVHAGAPSQLYKLQKLVRRNKGLVAAVAAVLVTLVAGLSLTAWQAVRATRAQQAAMRAQRAERVQAEQARTGRDRALLAESNATEKAIVATNALQIANERMAKLHTAEGWRRLEEGDAFGALVPFAEAFALEQDKPGRAEIHQMRLASVLQRCPKLVNIWSIGTNIDHAEFSRDGTRLLTASSHSETQSVARIWDAATGQPLSAPMPHAEWIIAMQWSADGSKVVTTSYDHTARVWDGHTGSPLTPPLRHEFPVVWAHFNSTGSRLVTAAWKDMEEDSSPALPVDQLALWDTATSHPVWKTNVALLESQDYAVITPDDEHIITSMEVRRVKDGTLVETLSFLPAIKERFSGVNSDQTVNAYRVAFNPDGSRIIVAPSSERFDLDWYHQAESALFDGRNLSHAIVKLKAPSRVRMAKFSPSGRRVAIANEGHLAKIMDAATGTAVGLPMRHASPISFLTFSPDGQWLATATEDGFARIWDTETGEPISPLLPHSGSLVRIAFNKDGTRLLALGFDGTARVWDLRTANTPRFSWRGSRLILNGVPMAPAVNPNANEPIINIGNGFSPEIVNLRSGDPILPPLIIPGSDFKGYDVFDQEFSPDGRWIYSGQREVSNTWTWVRWDVATGTSQTNMATFTKTKKEHPFRDFDGGRRFLVSQEPVGPHYDGVSVHVVQTTSNNQVVIEAALRDLKVSQDGTCMVGVNPDRSLSVWRSNDDWRRFTFGDTNVTRMSIIDLSESGEIFRTSCQEFSEVWRASTGERIMVMAAPPAKLSSDGAWLAEVNSKTIKLYSLKDKPVLVATLQNRTEAKELLFSEDARFLLMRDDFGVLRLWSVPSGDLIPVHESGYRSHHLNNLLFSPGTGGLLTRGEDQAVYFWPFPKSERTPQNWLAAAKVLSPGTSQAELDVSANPDQDQFQNRPDQHSGTPEVESWRTLRQSCPEWFAVSADEADAWERREALRCETAKDWSNAVVHLSRLLEMHPDNGAFLPRRAAAYMHWAEASLGNLDSSPASTRLMEQAVTDYNRTLAWVDRFPEVSKESRKIYQRSLSAALRRAGQTDEAMAILRELGAVVPRSSGTGPNHIDLTPYFNDAHFNSPGRTLIPTGVQRSLTGVQYDLRGAIGVGRTNVLGGYENAVRGIPIKRPARRIQFLQDGYSETDETGVYAQLIIHLDDGQSHTLELRFQEDFWWPQPEPSPRAAARPSSLAFDGDWPKFQRTWENPTPAVTVDRVDFIAVGADRSGGLYAITVEP